MAWKLSSVLRERSGSGSPDGYIVSFWCPGCRCAHSAHVEKPDALGAKHTLSGSLDAPTLAPAVVSPGCAVTVDNGELTYSGDSAHSFAGATIPMLAWPAEYD